MSSAAFDDRVGGYDDVAFSELGIELRQRVHEVLASLLDSSDNVVDLGCGTGIDAAWLASRVHRVKAFDPSPAMVEAAKTRCSALANVIVTQAEVGRIELVGQADLVLANFGVVNCVPDPLTLRNQLIAAVRPGGHAVLVSMPRWCPIELVVGVATRNRALVDRRKPGEAPADDYPGVAVRYASAAELAVTVGARFELLHAESLGLVLPPFEQRRWVQDRPRLLAALGSLDRRLGRLGAKFGVGDHHIAVFKRSTT